MREMFLKFIKLYCNVVLLSFNILGKITNKNIINRVF